MGKDLMFLITLILGLLIIVALGVSFETYMVNKPATMIEIPKTYDYSVHRDGVICYFYEQSVGYVQICDDGVVLYRSPNHE